MERSRVINEKIAVVGSGIVGSLAAYLLAGEGYEVWLIEEMDELLSGTSARAIQAHLGGLYSGSFQTAQECLRSAIEYKRLLPFGLTNLTARFLVADNSDITLAEYLMSYRELADYYGSLPSKDQLFGSPDMFFRILEPQEHRFAKNIQGGITTREPGLNMDRVRAVLLYELSRLGVKLINPASALEVRQLMEGFELTVDVAGEREKWTFDQVINAGGYRTRWLDHQIGDKTEYVLYLKTWNVVKGGPDTFDLPPFYVVRGDFMHFSPLDDRGLASLILATDEGSYIDRVVLDENSPGLPDDWEHILKTGEVPNRKERHQVIFDYAYEQFLTDARFEPVTMIPGVAVSFSTSRQDRTQRSINLITPGWQTLVPTKATHALELAQQAKRNAIAYSLESKMRRY